MQRILHDSSTPHAYSTRHEGRRRYVRERWDAIPTGGKKMAAFDKITSGDQAVDSGLEQAGVQQISREAWENNLSTTKPVSGESQLTGDTLDIPPADFGDSTTMGTMSADSSVTQTAGDALNSVSQQAEDLA